MKRFILLFTIVSLIVSILIIPAAAVSWSDTELTVINYLDYVDSSTVHVTADGKKVKIDIPSQYATLLFENDTGNDYIRGDDGETSLEAGDVTSNIRSWPTLNMEVGKKRTRQGYLFDVSNIPSGGYISFTWELLATGDYGWIGSNDDSPAVQYYTYYYDEPHDDGYSYEVGRGMGSGLNVDFNSGVLECFAVYEQGSLTSGVKSNYIAPYLTFRDVGVLTTPATIRVRTSSISVTFDITDELIEMAQNEKTQKLLNEVNRQLEEQGQTMDQILDQQQQTNDKIDGMTGYEPTPDNPDFQDSVDDLEDAEQDALDNVQTGMDDADQVFTSVFGVLGDYLQSFAAVSIIFETFADLPFFSALLSVSLALGIVAALLGIGIDAVRSSSRSSARSSKKGG